MAVTTTYAWTSTGNLSLTTGGSAAAPEVISLTGRAFAVSGDHVGGHIDGDLFNSTGVNVGDWNNGNVNNGTNSALAQLSNGNIVQVGQDADSILYEIVNSSTGATVLASTDIGDLGNSNADVTALPGGGFWVASEHFFNAGDQDIEINRYNGVGTFLSKIVVDGSFSTKDQAPSIAALTGGNVVVTYTRTIGAATEVRYAIYNSAGGVVLAPTILDAFGDIPAVNRQISVCALANGGFAVAYEDNGWLTGTVDITVGTYTSTGVFVDQANIGSTSDDANPYIAQLANGMLVVAFSRDLVDFDTYVKLLDSSTLDELASDTITAGESIFDDTINPAIAGYGYGQVAVFHANSTDADNQGEALQAVRTSTGDAGNNTVNGDDLLDKMNGGLGNDTLRGFGNKDILNGGAGIDTLNGGSQSDRLNGGSGSDTLTGAGGNDKFLFKNAFGASNIDTITDYVVADDTILIDNAIFTGLALGALAPAAFRIGAAAADGSDRIIYNFATGALYFDANGIAGVAQIQFAQLAPGLALTAADFIVI